MRQTRRTARGQDQLTFAAPATTWSSRGNPHRDRLVAIAAAVTLASSAGIAAWRWLHDASDNAWAAKAQTQVSSLDHQLTLLAQTSQTWQAQPIALRQQRPDVSAHLLERRDQLAHDRQTLIDALARYRQLPTLRSRAGADQDKVRELREQLALVNASADPDRARVINDQLQAVQEQQSRDTAQAAQATSDVTTARSTEIAADDHTPTDQLIATVTTLIQAPPPAPGTPPTLTARNNVQVQADGPPSPAQPISPGAFADAGGQPTIPLVPAPADAPVPPGIIIQGPPAYAPAGPPHPPAAPPRAPVVIPPAPATAPHAPTVARPSAGSMPHTESRPPPPRVSALPTPNATRQDHDTPKRDTPETTDHQPRTTPAPAEQRPIPLSTPPTVLAEPAPANPPVMPVPTPQVSPAATSGHASQQQQSYQPGPLSSPSSTGSQYPPDAARQPALDGQLTSPPAHANQGEPRVEQRPQVEQNPQVAPPAPRYAPREQRPEQSGPSHTDGALTASEVKKYSGSDWVARQSQTPEGKRITRELFGGSDSNQPEDESDTSTGRHAQDQASIHRVPPESSRGGHSSSSSSRRERVSRRDSDSTSSDSDTRNSRSGHSHSHDSDADPGDSHDSDSHDSDSRDSDSHGSESGSRDSGSGDPDSHSSGSHDSDSGHSDSDD